MLKCPVKNQRLISRQSFSSLFQVKINYSSMYLSLLRSFSFPYLTIPSFLFLCFSLSKILTNYFGIVVKQFPAQNLSLRAGVNFINILCVPFLYKSILHSFSLIAVWLCIFFWRKNISAKAACKMLMKLTTSGQFHQLFTSIFT